MLTRLGRSIQVICAVTLVVSAAACRGDSEPVTAVVYEGGRVIVGDGSTIDDAVFVVDSGRIVAMGSRASVTPPSGAVRVTLTGRTIMPMIVDTHVHLSTTPDAVVADLEHRAYFGVGAAMSMGSDTEDAPLALRADTVHGRARFRSAGTGITRPEPGRRQVHWVNTDAEAREAVRREKARDVDLIKIWVDDRGGQYQALTPVLYGAVIDEAHANGLEVAAHIFALDDAKGLLRAGIDIFAHGVRDRDIDDEFARMVAERRDVVLIPNLPARGAAIDVTWLAGMVPDDTLKALQAGESDAATREAFAIQARNLARLAAQGMTVVVGTDGNTPWAPHVEMEDMVAAGLTPAQVIVAATRNGAALLAFDDMGTLEAGKRADFIVLEANPLDDITNTRRIAAVYQRGTEVDRTGIRARAQAR